MDEGKWFDEKEGALLVRLRVQPKSSRNEVVGVYGDALKVKLTSPPVDGAANAMLIKFIARQFMVSRASVSILSGDKSKNKLVSLKGLTKDKLEEILGNKVSS